VSRTAFSPRIFLCLFVALALTACGGAAAATEPSQELPSEALPTATLAVFPPPVASTSQPSLIPTALPAIPERRRIIVEFPPTIRAGDSDIVRLTLEVNDLGNLTPTAEFDGNVVTGEVIEIPNLYESHQVIAEARFDIAGLQVSPPELISQPLAQGQSITFHWSILPEGVGIYRGTIWFYLRFVDKVSGEERQRVVSAQPVEIEAVNFLGLSLSFVRSFGVIGSIVGTVIGFPFLEDVIKFLFRKKKK